MRLEDEEFRAQYEQARGAVESAKARLLENEHGSRPEEIEQADHNLSEARATAVNDKINLDRTRDLFAQGVASKQSLDDATAKYESSQQRMNSLERAFKLMQLGPRSEEIERAKGDLLQAEGQMAYAKSQLDATVIRAPVSGTILERTAEKGELVTAQFASGAEGGPRGSVVALADLNDIQVELDIAQDDFAKLSPKQEGIVTLDAFKDRSYKGEIAEMSPEANRQKATVQVKVQILQPDSYLRPEMNATVQFKAKASETAANDKSADETDLRFCPHCGVARQRRSKVCAARFQRQGAPPRCSRSGPALRRLSGGLAGRRRKRNHRRARGFARRAKDSYQGAIMSATTQTPTQPAVGSKVVQARGVSKIFKRDAFQVTALDNVSHRHRRRRVSGADGAFRIWQDDAAEYDRRHRPPHFRRTAGDGRKHFSAERWPVRPAGATRT